MRPGSLCTGAMLYLKRINPREPMPSLEPFIIWDKKGGGDTAFSVQENKRDWILCHRVHLWHSLGEFTRKQSKIELPCRRISKNGWWHSLLSLRRPHLPWNGLKANILCPECIGYSSNIFRDYMKHMCVCLCFISLNVVGIKLSGNVYS